MSRAFYFSRKFTLTARAIAGLAARFDLAAFADITRNHVQIFVVEALALGAICRLAPAPASPVAPARKTAAPRTAATLLVAPRAALSSVS